MYRCTAAREICERHQVVQLRDPMKPPIHHCTMVLRVSTGAPIWSHYVKKHKPLGQHNNLFQSENISTIIRCATHREMSVCLMTSWTEHVTIKNCQSAWDQHFCWFHGRVEVLEKYFIQFNLTRARNSFLCVRVDISVWWTKRKTTKTIQVQSNISRHIQRFPCE